MRILRLTTNYGRYLADFYAARPDLASLPFEAQHRALMDDCFGWADFWTRALAPLGHEAWEPVANAEPMQKAWARERGVPYREDRWLEDITAAQVAAFRPDVLLFSDYVTFSADFVRGLRASCPSIRLVVGRCGSPFRDERFFRACDLVLSNIPGLVDRFRGMGLRSEFMAHAFAPVVLERMGPPDGGEPIPFSFVGSLSKGESGHNERERALDLLARRAGLRIWCDVRRATPEDRRELAMARRRYALVRAISALPGGAALAARVPKMRRYAEMAGPPALPAHVVLPSLADRAEPPRYGLSMFRTLRRSLVTFNNHIDLSAEHASNMRLFEATGVGACLLTERQRDLSAFFEPDAEVVTYGSPEEAAERALWLLDHEAERRAIAGAGMRRTLRDHTFDRRARELDALIRRELGS